MHTYTRTGALRKHSRLDFRRATYARLHSTR